MKLKQKNVGFTQPVDSQQAGFTIIELLIATLVFSTILLLCTAGMVQIGRMYYKGIISARTQETARAAISDISQGVQFAGGSIKPYLSGPGTWEGFCLGNQLYSYRVGVQRTASNVYVFVREPVNDCAAVTAAKSYGASLPAGDQELLGLHMRIDSIHGVALMKSLPDNLYQINIRVLYGDDQILVGATPPHSCIATRLGGQFCAASELGTVVEKRIE